MKKIIILLVFLVSGFASADAQSMLKVSLADRSVINISVDGRYFNKRGTTVTVGDLPPGRHSLKIFVASQDRRGRAREDVLYEGNVKTHNGSVTLFVYDANTDNIDIQEQDMDAYMANNPQPNNNAPMNNGNNGNNRFGYNDNNNYPNNQGNNNNYQNNNNGNYNNNNAPVASPAPVGTLTDDKTAKLKDRIAAKAADTQKLTELESALNDETYTTDQVGTMMDWLIFDETKVSFAKWAYTHVVDKDNFKSVENKFSYKNSQDDIDKFLQGQK